MPDIDANIARLTALGLTPNEARCYTALLAIAPATAGEVADFSGVPRPKVYATLKSLEQRKFCYASGDRITTFRPVDPELALDELLRNREHDRRLADERDRQVSAELVAVLPSPPEHAMESVTSHLLQLTGDPGPTIEIYEGMIDRAKRRLDVVHTTPSLQVPERWNLCEIAALERDVQVRALYVSREHALERRYQQITEAGGEARLARSGVLKMLMRDDGAEAMVALEDQSNKLKPACVVVRHIDLVVPLQRLFNNEWRKARPLPASSQTPATRRRRAPASTRRAGQAG